MIAKEKVSLKSEKKIVLVGMPCSGKTYCGAKLAEKYELPFFDLDEIIERQVGKEITEIFELFGEVFFREKERQILIQILENKTEFILATGGGTPCFFNNMQLINAMATSLWLDTTPQTLLHRLRQQPMREQRPLWAAIPDDQLHTQLLKTHAQRSRYYAMATHTIAEAEIELLF